VRSIYAPFGDVGLYPGDIGIEIIQGSPVAIGGP